MLGVIIGRFQTPHLTDGHLKLFEEAYKNHDQILILIGVSDAIGTDKNPLSYQCRDHLIHSSLPDNWQFRTGMLRDCPSSDKDWSNSIDSIIEQEGYEDAVIYGGRDNSIQGYYKGKHRVKIIKAHSDCSATTLRKEIAKNPSYNYGFRAGIIHHIENRYPIVYSTVDVVVMGFNEERRERTVLMGKKGDKFCFVGGFVDPSDPSLHHAAIRELKEETGFGFEDVANWTYVASMKVEDARYRGTKDSIMTNLWSVKSINNELPDQSKISDKEFKEFSWLPLCAESLRFINTSHVPLFLTLISK